MIQKIKEPVSVTLFFGLKELMPKSLIWRGRFYPITKLGLHHSYREGRTLYHIFSFVSHTLFFRLKLNTESLTWKLEEISDGLSH